MRREKGDVNFYRTWSEYRKGFGKTNGDFWIGLHNIFSLVKFSRLRPRRRGMLLLAAAVYDLPTETVSLCLAVDSARTAVGVPLCRPDSLELAA